MDKYLELYRRAGRHARRAIKSLNEITALANLSGISNVRSEQIRNEIVRAHAKIQNEFFAVADSLKYSCDSGTEDHKDDEPIVID